MADDDDGLAGLAVWIIGLILVVGAILAIVAISVSIGAFFGACCTVYNLCCGIADHIGVRLGTKEEHARVRYFHWDGDWFRNFLEICGDTWQRNVDMMPERFEGDGPFETAFNIAKAVSLVLATGIVVPLLFLILSLVFLLVWLAYTTLSLLARGISFLVDKAYGLFTICRVCHKKIDLPVYVCPECGVEHRRLIPTAKFGPFFRYCQCGHPIPVMRWLGRAKLRALCPNCKLPLDDSKFAPVSIVLVGGSSVGKSQLVMDSVVAIRDRLASELGQTVSIPSDDAPKVEELVRNYETGISPSITPDTAIEAICLEMKGQGMLFPKRLYLYDPPGESFRESAKIVRHRYYEHMKVVVFVIDPSTMPEVMEAYADAETPFAIPQIGAQSAEENLNQWLLSMEQEYQDLVSKAVCAAVVSKADEPSLDSIAGLSAGDGDEKCRAFLSRFGNGNLLALLEANFRKVRCFAVGSVGSGGNGRAFSPVGLDEMLKWILEES